MQSITKMEILIITIGYELAWIAKNRGVMHGRKYTHCNLAIGRNVISAITSDAFFLLRKPYYNRIMWIEPQSFIANVL